MVNVRNRLFAATLAVSTTVLTGASLLIASPAIAAAPTTQVGLFGSQDPTYDGAFRQSLGLLAYVAADLTPPADAVDWLVGQQCTDGGFEAFRADTSQACAPSDPANYSGEDTNSTGMAAVALRALGKTAEADDAVAWLIEHLRIEPGRQVVDLAAGTGKLTRLLAPAGADLIAAEPVAGMRETFRTILANVPIIASTAEQLALRDASLDAVTIAQAFHWFDEDRAIAELARAVRPGGRVALVWNARDRSVPWVDRVWGIMDRVEKRAPWRDHDNWSNSAVREMSGFGPLHSAEFRHEQIVTPQAMVQRVASVSHVAVLPDPERAAVLDEVAEVLRTDPSTSGRDALAVPYRVDCFWFERE